MTATVKFFRLFLLAAVIGAASTAWAADPLRLRSPRRILFAYVRSRAERDDEANRVTLYHAVSCCIDRVAKIPAPVYQPRLSCWSIRRS